MARHPFLWIAGGVISGLLLGELGYWGLLGVALIATAVLISWMHQKVGRTGWALTLFALLGWLRNWVEHRPNPQDIRLAIGRVGYVRGYLVEEPFRTRRAWRLLLRVQSWRLAGDSVWQSAAGHLLLYTKDSSNLAVGAQLEALVRLDSIRFGTQYWSRQGIGTSAYSPDVRRLGWEPSYVAGYFLRVRARLIDRLRATFPDTGATRALLEALLLGYTRGLDPETRATFQLTGAAHILAVSGLHVGLVLTFSLWILGRVLPPGRDRHPLITGLMLALVWFYGLLTGASPSAMRAVIMGSLALIARSAYLRYDALNALGVASFLQLLLEPSLLKHAGFGLSYLAVLGILAWYSPLRRFLQALDKVPRLGVYLRDLLSISLAAQAGTLGLSWALFGQFPVYFLLANLVAVPLSSLLAQLGLVWLAVIPIPLLGKGGAWVIWLLSKALLLILGFIQQLPGGVLSLAPITLWQGLAVSGFLVGSGFAYQTWRQVERRDLIV